MFQIRLDLLAPGDHGPMAPIPSKTGGPATRRPSSVPGPAEPRTPFWIVQRPGPHSVMHDLVLFFASTRTETDMTTDAIA